LQRKHAENFRISYLSSIVPWEIISGLLLVFAALKKGEIWKRQRRKQQSGGENRTWWVTNAKDRLYICIRKETGLKIQEERSQKHNDGQAQQKFEMSH